jgi:ORF6N domain
MATPTSIVPLRIESRILTVRGMKVIIDADLAELYGVATKRLNEQVKRNPGRFPADFMFQLTASEKAEVVANCDHLTRLKFARTLPMAFTEFGAIQASNVLNSSQAIEMGVYVVRAFVQQRELLASSQEWARQLRALEQRIERKLGSHDQAIAGLIDTLRQLMAPPDPPKRPIGFTVPAERTPKDSKTGKAAKTSRAK